MVSASCWTLADEILPVVFPSRSLPFPPRVDSMRTERSDSVTDLDGSIQSDSIFFFTAIGSDNTGIKLLVPGILLTGGLGWKYADLALKLRL